MDAIQKVLYVTSSPYGDNEPRFTQEKATLDKYLAKGWLIKDLHVVSLASGGHGGGQSCFQTIYVLGAPLSLVKKLAAEERKELGIAE